MKQENDIWQKMDKVISHLVRDGQINLAVEAGKARDEHLKLMEDFRDYKKSIEKIVYNTECRDMEMVDSLNKIKDILAKG